MNSRQRRKLAAERHNARLEREKTEGPTPPESRENVGTVGHVDHASSRRSRMSSIHRAMLMGHLAAISRTQEPNHE